MITYKQLSLADIFTDCQNIFDNGFWRFANAMEKSEGKETAYERYDNYFAAA